MMKTVSIVMPAFNDEALVRVATKELRDVITPTSGLSTSACRSQKPTGLRSGKRFRMSLKSSRSSRHAGRRRSVCLSQAIED
jgi:hypothetical protein